MNNSQETQAIYIDEYDYLLVDERIAKFPLPQRDTSKLLVYKNNTITESIFSNITDYLPDNCLLVYNNTRVIQARLEFFKETGGRVEVFCLEPLAPSDYAQSLSSINGCTWKCMVGNLKKWKEGKLYKSIVLNGKSFTFSAERLETEANTHTIKFSWDNTDIHFADILDKAGELPIPPYLNRKTEESDLTTYQTVYSKIKGSVAAPTAGLHFTPEVLSSLSTKNIETQELTLHVGAGTFQPVKTRNIAEHHMHTEVISVNKTTIEHLKQKFGNIIAVGTTSVRTLESLYYIGVKLCIDPNTTNFHINQWMPYECNYTYSVTEAFQAILNYLTKNNLSVLHADTQIMIKPGYEFKVVEGIITNFHQPKSTLLLLISAFVKGNWKTIYNYALKNNFRFLSYGDSSLLLK